MTFDEIQIMMYKKYNGNPCNIVDFTNIDWKSLLSDEYRNTDFLFDISRNYSLKDGITVRALPIRWLSSPEHGIAITKAKDTDGDDIIILESKQMQSMIFMTPIVQIKQDIYYLPFTYLMKILELNFVNLDKLPSEVYTRMRDQYHKNINAIYTEAQKTVPALDMTKNDKVSYVIDTQDFVYQNPDNLNELVFVKLYINKLMQNYRRLTRYSPLYMRDKSIKGRRISIFNAHPAISMLTQAGYENRPYSVGYYGSSIYASVLATNDAYKHYHIAVDSVENRLKANRMTAGGNNIQPFYYDYGVTNKIYQFGLNLNGGNSSVRIYKKSTNAYDPEDLVQCIY